MDSFARWIKNDEVRFFFDFIDHLQHVSGEETAVGKAVCLCVLFCSCNSFFHDFHADHFFCDRCKDLGNGSGSAVEVEDRAVFRRADELAGGAVENFRAKGIGLEEGERGDLEFQSEEFFIEVVLSVEHFCLIALYNICQGIIYNMEESDNLSFQRQTKHFLHERHQIPLFLACGDEVYQDFSGILGSSHQQVAQVTLVAYLVVVTCVPLFKVRQHAGQNLCEILMHDFAVARGQDIVGASLFMKSERQRAVLVFIAEGKLHFIPVCKLLRTSLDSKERIIGLPRLIDLAGLHEGIVEQFFHLTGLHCKLILITHRLVHASAAGRENTADRIALFHRGFFCYFEQAALHAVLSFFVDLKADLLSRNCIFHGNRLALHMYTSFIREINSFHDSLVNFSFFHSLLLLCQTNFRTEKLRYHVPAPEFLFSILLIFVFILEVIVEIVIEIIFEVFQIIRSYKPVYCVCDSCNCRYRSDNGKDP
ncbi:unknown [Blautia sp. CAG:37]|nr:unknown [Blautia sp. CAG:37]